MSGRVLVVDDIEANVKLLDAKLSSEYFDVLTAYNGPTALEIAETELPDVILLDVMMPRMDGFEVCRQLKANRRTVDVPVVMVTALSDTANRLRGLEAGAARLLDVVGRRGGRELRAQDALAGQVEVTRVLEDGAGHHLADLLALQPQAGDEPVEGGGEHVLVGRPGIGGVGAGERDPVPADDRCSTNGRGAGRRLRAGCHRNLRGRKNSSVGRYSEYAVLSVT